MEIHGNKYDYSLVDYKKSKEKVKIICKKHGIFEQKPCTHLLGRGCSKCHLESTVGWNWKTWKSKGINSVNFDSFKVYIIKCWNENEEFYKIGRTYTTIERRFRDDMRLPYNYKLIKIFKGKAKKIFDMEIKLKSINKNNKYEPNFKFKGYTECYKNIQI